MARPPVLFDATGAWQGYEDIRRSSVYDDGTVTYRMDGGLEGGGPLAGRFKLGAPFAFGVTDAGGDRLYTGPDFHGSGRPYGVRGRPLLRARLAGGPQHLEPDDRRHPGLLVAAVPGAAVVGCFNGLYTRDPAQVADWLRAETANGPVPYILPTKQAGAYGGACEVFGPDQKPRGTVRVTVELEPIDLLRTRHHVTWTGALDRRHTVEVRRDGFRSFFEGPGAWGNAQAYGRASFPSLHFADGTRLAGREFMMDATAGMGAGATMAVACELFEGNVLAAVLHGVLTWSSS
ncbi:hypothetical protein ACFQ0B_50375 [Nonomuraea thailandensis]